MSELQRTPNKGEWLLFDGTKRIAVFCEVKLGRNQERMIRVVTWAEKSEDRSFVGYFPHLEIAAWTTYRFYLRAIGRLD